MKKILIHTLLKSYSYLVIAIIVFFATVLSYINWWRYDYVVMTSEQQLVHSLKEELDTYQSRIRYYVYELSVDGDKMYAMTHYFEMDYASYQQWLLDHPLLLVKDISMQKTVQNLYQQLPFATGIDITLVKESVVFSSTSSFKSGFKMDANRYKAPKNSIPVNLYDVSTSEIIGTIYVSLDTSAIEQFIDRQTDLPVMVLVEDSLQRVLYKRGQLSKSQQVISATSGDLTIGLGLDESYVYKEVGRLTVIICLVSGLLIGILLVGLNRVFHHYQVQVTDLVETIEVITQDDNHVRIETENKQQELHLISTRINEMLDSLETSIGDIYRLQLAQKDADMRALQAQINPHFLYNTLEFFRMYAVTKDMDELADMIVEFSSLLRSSISQDKMTTVAQELSLCEKYSYICQIRYPKSIAYSYQIEKGCEDVVIPRFIVQPLVENYFVHGVDLMRQNNAISVRVTRFDKDIEILIRDNGKGMPEEVLKQYGEILSSRELTEKSPMDSIGIINVHERLLLYFGERYHITVQSKKNEGVQYSIYLKEIITEEEEHGI